MITATATKKWSCKCGYYGVKLFKKEGELDYSFFMARHYEAISYASLQGHTAKKCKEKNNAN